MKCKHCEKEIAEGILFCPYCGKAVEKAEEKAVEAPFDIEAIAKKVEAALGARIDTAIEKLKAPVDKKDIYGAEFKEGAEIVPGRAPEDKSPNATFGEGAKGWTNYLAAVWNAGAGRGLDKRLLALPSKTMTVGSDSAGGFLVPTEFRPQLIERALETSVVKTPPRGATVIPDVQGDSILFPSIEDTTHATTLYGGVDLRWTEEATTKHPSEPKVSQKKWEAHELSGTVPVANKLIRFSSIAIGPLLTRLLGGALGWKTDDAYINGTGAGMPLGILASGGLLAVSRIAGQAATIVPENLSSMLSRLNPAAMERAVWIAHSYVRKELQDLVRVMGTAGTLVYQQDIKAKPVWTLYGLPIRFTEKCPVIGTPGDLILADLESYWVVDFGAIEIAASPHVDWKDNVTNWRIVAYTDGQPVMDSPLTLKDGTSQVADFVVIEVRPAP